MTQDTVSIRNTTSQDRDAILAVHMNAFGGDEGPVIAKLVDEMLDDATGEPLLSLVAEANAGLVGHILFTSASVEPDQAHIRAQILAPLAVAEDRQRQGIGGQLINAGLVKLKDSGVDLVFVLGDPNYYSRFGFEPAGVHDLQATYPIPPQYADAWMVQELTPGAIENSEGTVRCSKALDDPKHWLE